MLCDYGCGKEAKYQFKNGKWCCESHWSKCIINRTKKTGEGNPVYGKKYSLSKETKKKMSEAKIGKTFSLDHKKKLSEINKGKNNAMYGKVPWNKGKTNIYSKETKKKMRKPKNENQKIKISITKSFSISNWKKRYPTFAKIEEMRYNPDKPGEKEIQVQCKNHNCPNSKEQGGWFTPTKTQFYERKRQIEENYGNDGSYFYCSNECKEECPLFKIKGDPFKVIKKFYTEAEYQLFRRVVLDREEEICEYCGEPANTVHHIMPQKLEPWHVLDPDYGVACCTKCHYKYGHKDECGTGVIAAKEVCNGYT